MEEAGWNSISVAKIALPYMHQMIDNSGLLSVNVG